MTGLPSPASFTCKMWLLGDLPRDSQVRGHLGGNSGVSAAAMTVGWFEASDRDFVCVMGCMLEGMDSSMGSGPGLLVVV